MAVLASESLLLASLTFVVEELGVPCAELTGDLESAPVRLDGCDGDAVPPGPSFFFEVLFESFALDNDSC